jgi:ubiquinone/menaquinone biosynthesis C-methylase UbiE
VGCGTGNLAILAKRLHPDAELFGLDPDPRALARAQRKAQRAKLDVHFDEGFAGRLPYADASFDRALSAFMFHHLAADERPRMLRELARILKPSGSLHLVDFGETDHRSRGVIARLSRRSKRLQDNFGDRIPTLMRDAGFLNPVATAHRTRILGPITSYHATR